MSQLPQQPPANASNLPAPAGAADSDTDEGSQQGVLQILRQIKAGTLDPKLLKPEDRQACVTHLGLEGAAVPEIAQLLGVSDRTIARDRRVIQQQHAIHADPDLGPLIAGRLMQEAETSNVRLRRIGRDPQTPPAVKVASEQAAYEVYDKAVQRLQSLGILPQMATHVHAEWTHHTGDLQSLAEIRRELDYMENLQLAAAAPQAVAANVTVAKPQPPRAKESP